MYTRSKEKKTEDFNKTTTMKIIGHAYEFICEILFITINVVHCHYFILRLKCNLNNHIINVKDFEDVWNIAGNS